MDAAAAAGAEVRFETEALPVIEGDRVIGVEASQRRSGHTANGARRSRPTSRSWPPGRPAQVARMLGADRVEDEPFGLAIRTYAETPRHADVHLEACCR